MLIVVYKLTVWLSTRSLKIPTIEIFCLELPATEKVDRRKCDIVLNHTPVVLASALGIYP